MILQDEGALISEIPAIANRDGRATDEEKLASTTSAQKPAGLEKKGEPEDDLEYFECSNVPVPAVKHGTETGKMSPPHGVTCAASAACGRAVLLARQRSFPTFIHTDRAKAAARYSETSGCLSVLFPSWKNQSTGCR